MFLRGSVFLNFATSRFDMNFKNKVVLITGASSGIGAAAAILFAEAGAHVVIVGRNENRLNKVREDCEKFGNKPLLIKADLSKDEEVRNIINETIHGFGKLDVLINNAGMLRRACLLDENVLDVYDEVMATNLRGMFHITSLAAPYLIKTGGNIINVSSVAGATVLGPGYMPYSVTKAGVDHFSRGIALELAPYGVRVNTINPGPVKTAIFDTAGVPKDIDKIVELTALKKVSESEEVAELMLFLASDKATSITGGSYFIDNGFTLNH